MNDLVGACPMSRGKLFLLLSFHVIGERDRNAEGSSICDQDVEVWKQRTRGVLQLVKA